MPRRPRFDLTQVPQHIVQRGNDRQPTFFADIERVRYLADLNEITLRERCHVHAYILMTHHVHLLLTPTATGQTARVMQSLGRPDCGWSSFHANARGMDDPLVHPHSDHLARSPDPALRKAACCALVMEPLYQQELDPLRQHLHSQHAYATNRFRAKTEAQPGRPAGRAKIGQPRKSEPTNAAESAL